MSRQLPTSDGILHKSFPLDVVSVDEAQGIVKAIVSVFGNIDDGDDIIHPGSCVKTLNERFGRIRVLNSHRNGDVLNVIGKPLSMREVGRDELPEKVKTRSPEATGGLLTETQFLLTDPTSKGVFDRIAAGFVDEYSIGFDIIQSDYSKATGGDGKPRTVRNIREIRLWEYSVVAWGMNPVTGTVDAKSADDVSAEPSIEPAADLPAEQQKEYTPDGPQKRLGDQLMAEILKTVHRKLDGYLADGYLSGDEYKQMLGVCDSACETIRTGMPEDVSLRPIVSFDDWFFFGKDAPDQMKAGRVLSERNYTRIQEAKDALDDVLKEARPADTSEEDKAASEPAQPEQPQAGSLPAETAPTASTMEEAGPQASETPTDPRALKVAIELGLAELEELSHGNANDAA